jgi:hypothetical protein
MTRQTTPHTQTEQNVNPAQSDLEQDEMTQASGTGDDAGIYDEMDGAETGGDRAPRKILNDENRTRVQDAPASYEGSLTTRTPKGDGQGITSRSQREESERQEKVVEDRPDAEAGINQGRR